MERDRLDGVVCTVTGGAQGIGFATATELARVGGRIAIVDLDVERTVDAARQLAPAHGAFAEGFAANVAAGRWGLPEEVGRLIAFIAQPGSGFINGAVIPIDGGFTIRGDPGEDIDQRSDSLDAVERLFGRK